MDVDTVTQKITDTKYGYETGLGFGNEAKFALQTPFVDYMDAYPFEQNGLWTVVQMILPETTSFDINMIKYKYEKTERIICK